MKIRENANCNPDITHMLSYFMAENNLFAKAFKKPAYSRLYHLVVVIKCFSDWCH